MDDIFSNRMNKNEFLVHNTLLPSLEMLECSERTENLINRKSILFCMEAIPKKSQLRKNQTRKKMSKSKI